MNISSFYQHSKCEHIAAMQNLIHEVTRYPKFCSGVKMSLASLTSGNKNEAILKQLHEYLRSEYSKLEQTFSWQATVEAQNDTLRFKRFLEYLTINGYVPVKSLANASVEVKTKLPDGSFELSESVELICTKKNGNKNEYFAFVIHVGQSSIGLQGRSVNTNIANNLHPLVAKLALEEKYPRVNVCIVYLSHEKDAPSYISPDFLVSPSAASNMYKLSYDDYYTKEGVFERNRMLDMVEYMIVQKTDYKCSGCGYYSLCNSPVIDSADKHVVAEVEQESKSHTYRIPQYTEDQMAVVHHVDGPLRVCAGPGSGKTATLIGRIKYLVEEVGIDPSFLLVVTFTEKAATELKERCLSFLPEDNLPTIATLNAFCYGILRENADVLDKNLKLLDTGERLRLIQNIASVFPPLRGFKIGQTYGKTGLYNTIANRLDYFFTTTEEGFFYKYPECGQDFIEFANQYREIVELNDYITFDEQISLTNELFQNYPEILSIYQSIYKYIMVDEYQDVNQMQVDMLYALADRHKNIVVVGDDDQCIYGFRNASSEFMIHFDEAFPGAKTVVFRKNFRSTQSLVEASKALIGKNINRIPKDISAGKSQQDNEKVPVLVPSLEPSILDTLIKQLIVEGYCYSDIAVLSVKNALLEKLHNALSVPTVLAKSFLRQDGLFLLILSILKLNQDMSSDRFFYLYMKLFGAESLLKRIDGLSLYESLLSTLGFSDVNELLSTESDSPCVEPLRKLYGTFIPLLENASNLIDFVGSVALFIDWKSSDSATVLCDCIRLQQIGSIDALCEYMSNLLLFEDDKKVEIARGDRVLLSTSHDSKGKEFKVVILMNDFSGGSEEVRRLFYVAMTRAEERFYIMQNQSAMVDFLSEIPHDTLDLDDKRTA